MCHSSGLLFHKNSRNIQYASFSVTKIPKHGSVFMTELNFPGVGMKIVENESILLGKK